MKHFGNTRKIDFLSCHFENGSFFDICATKTCEEKRGMTNNLPRELPRIPKVILDRGVKVTAELIGEHCYRSLLVKD